jgi:hypothetical protein
LLFFRRTSGSARQSAGIVRAMGASRTHLPAGISRCIPERDTSIGVREVRLLTPRQSQCSSTKKAQLPKISSDLSPNIPICSAEMEAIETYLAEFLDVLLD